METLDITEVARRTGLTPRALRFYEARGLVAPLRTAAGRRHYGAGDLARLNTVVALKRAGFSLAEIAQIMSRRQPDLARLVSARLAALDARVAELDRTRTLLRAVQSRLDHGEPVDIALLCSLIQTGGIVEHENWQAVSDRYLSAEAKSDFALAPYPIGFDQAAYAASWTDLATRIETALPMDPTSDQARAFKAEWSALLAPFTAIATPAMAAGVEKMYDGIGDWQAEQKPPFSAAVWAFIKSVPT